MEPLPPLRKILVVQHVACEPLGTLDPLLRRRKVRVRYHNAVRSPDAPPDLGGVDAVIVLGGPQNLDEQDRYPHLKHELALLTEVLRRGLPVLGICLGAQLLAHALGARVGRNAQRELGWADLTLTEAGKADPVLSALGTPAPMFHWHGDTFALPSGAAQLAHTALCQQQAFRYGDLAYGLQFHMEVDAELIARWLEVYRHELALTHGPDAAALVTAQTRARIGDLQARSALAFDTLLQVWGWQPRQPAVQLGHRMTVQVADDCGDG